MKLTNNGTDLEAEVAERCVRALTLEGRHKGTSSTYRVKLDDREIGRILRYLADRFNARLETK